MHFPQTTIYSICSHCGGEGSWVQGVTSGKSIIPSWGDSQGFIRVFLDFPAGRNLQPKAQGWCKGGISPPQPCLQAPVVIRGSGGLWSPFIAAHQGLLGSHSLWDPSQELSQQEAGMLLFHLDKIGISWEAASSWRC